MTFISAVEKETILIKYTYTPVTSRFYLAYHDKNCNKDVSCLLFQISTPDIYTKLRRKPIHVFRHHKTQKCYKLKLRTPHCKSPKVRHRTSAIRKS